jgi:NAD(P)-dependent dehydrogenase (short-subunit alcohol dehydrogenase family)
MRLESKVAVITGAGSGIGRAMAWSFAGEGAKVVVADVVAGRVEEVVSHITSSGGNAIGVVTDVALEEDIDRMIKSATDTYGRLDILCNNAGIMDRMTPVADTSNDLWDRVLKVNLTGPFLACRKSLPIMLKHGGGVILNTASIGGLYGGRAGAAYTASKHALVGLSKNIAYMYAEKGIRCNALCPGAVKTAIGVGGEAHEHGLRRMQLGAANMGRISEPAEIAEVALFLVSDESSFINGAAIVVDGGWTAY